MVNASDAARDHVAAAHAKRRALGLPDEPEVGSAAIVREGFQVEFECGHTMVYDKHSQHGIPEIGQLGRCHRCDDLPEPNAGVDRRVVGLRQCWIETTTRVLFEEPKS